MDFVKNLGMTYVVGGGGGVKLFASLWPIADENQYVNHSLYLNTFVTIEKMEPRNYD